MKCQRGFIPLDGFGELGRVASASVITKCI